MISSRSERRAPALTTHYSLLTTHHLLFTTNRDHKQRAWRLFGCIHSDVAKPEAMNHAVMVRAQHEQIGAEPASFVQNGFQDRSLQCQGAVHPNPVRAQCRAQGLRLRML